MDEEELIKERFEAAISSAVKVISEQFDLKVKFGNNINKKKDSLNLPEVANLRNLQDVTNLRAFADSEALKIKYMDKKIYHENEPKGTMAKALYAIAEKIRYEKIGSSKLQGVKNNITQCYENKFYKQLNGKIPIIGVGGVNSGKSAYEKIIAGASLLQLYTGLVYKGPTVVKEIKKELIQILKDEGINNLKDAIGKGI